MKSSAIHGESGYRRLDGDAYFTESWCTEALLSACEPFRHVIDPFIGNNWMKALEAGAKANQPPPNQQEA